MTKSEKPYLGGMDIFGKALLNYYEHNTNEILWLHNSYHEPEIMPVNIFFREEEEMPELELIALEHCRGKILDVGAGAGSHALLLQTRGFDITAIDISENAVSIMKHRGVKKAVKQDIINFDQQFDTLLFLMNGIGLTGTLPGFIDFLDHAASLLKPGGQLIFDSSDISYLYNDLPKPTNRYFGEVSYCYEYLEQKGNWFDWVYIDEKTLFSIAEQKGWQCEILFDDGEDQYLAKLSLKTN